MKTTLGTITLILVQLFLIQAVFSQGLPTAKPEEVGMSSDRLNRINPVMQSYVDENIFPGLITLVARRGKVVHFEKYGMMDIDKPMQFNTIFRIASMTKPITSVAVMMLYEEGHFQLFDPISKYIPEFKDLKVFSSTDENGLQLVDQNNQITIHDLLTHTAAINRGSGNTPQELIVDSLYRQIDMSDGTLKDMTNKIAEIPLLYQPGTKWSYSNASTNVLAHLVEVISDKPFNEFLEERIFIPLNMKDTDFYVPEEKINRFAALYRLSENSGIKVLEKQETSAMSTPPKFYSAAGGLVSTVTDYAIFAQMLLNKGEFNGTRLLGRKTVEFMTQNHLSEELLPIKMVILRDGMKYDLIPGLGFGLGFGVTIDVPKSHTLASLGRFMWSGSFTTAFWVDPEEEMIGILMTQVSPSQHYYDNEFLVLVYQAIVD
jgi:CubicO group peptidase (beta-lactamase class C family)